MNAFEIAGNALAVAVAVVAAVRDTRSMQIPNWLTFPGMAVGLALGLARGTGRGKWRNWPPSSASQCWRGGISFPCPLPLAWLARRLWRGEHERLIGLLDRAAEKVLVLDAAFCLPFGLSELTVFRWR